MPMKGEHWMSAKTLREAAQKWDQLAQAARSEGDWFDHNQCAAEADNCRRLARRAEMKE